MFAKAGELTVDKQIITYISSYFVTSIILVKVPNVMPILDVANIIWRLSAAMEMGWPPWSNVFEGDEAEGGWRRRSGGEKGHEDLITI